jgi:hypothetical protein
MPWATTIFICVGPTTVPVPLAVLSLLFQVHERDVPLSHWGYCCAP